MDLKKKYKNFRFITIRKFPYIVVYEVFESKIVVFTVRSTSKDPEKLKRLLSDIE